VGTPPYPPQTHENHLKPPYVAFLGQNALNPVFDCDRGGSLKKRFKRGSTGHFLHIFACPRVSRLKPILKTGMRFHPPISIHVRPFILRFTRSLCVSTKATLPHRDMQCVPSYLLLSTHTHVCVSNHTRVLLSRRKSMDERTVCLVAGSGRKDPPCERIFKNPKNPQKIEKKGVKRYIYMLPRVFSSNFHYFSGFSQNPPMTPHDPPMTPP
jgi:hypothetical protein